MTFEAGDIRAGEIPARHWVRALLRPRRAGRMQRWFQDSGEGAFYIWANKRGVYRTRAQAAQAAYG